MIFRTGSILIVGHCDESKLYIIYDYLVNMFKEEFNDINEGIIVGDQKKKVNKKVKKQTLLFDV